MILLFVIVCELIILAFSAMMQPGRTKASAAARATGQPQPRENRAARSRRHNSRKPWTGPTTPPRTEGTPGSTTDARTRRDGRRQHAAELPTAKTGSYTQPTRAETIHGSRALDGPKTTSPKPPNPPKSTDQPTKTAGSRLDFLHFSSRFSIFSRFFLDFLPSPSRRRLDFSPFSPPIRRKFLDFSAPILDFLQFHNAQAFPNFSNFLQFPKFCRFFSISRAPSVLPFSPFCAIIFSNKFSSFRHKFPKHPIW